VGLAGACTGAAAAGSTRFRVFFSAAALAWGVGFASNEEIDAQGILPATRLAMQRALQALSLPPQHLLIDALRLPGDARPQTALIKGDARSLSIAAASVLAKTSRDALMTGLEGEHPAYRWEVNKGYAAPEHLAALERHGPCDLHRRSWRLRGPGVEVIERDDPTDSAPR